MAHAEDSKKITIIDSGPTAMLMTLEREYTQLLKRHKSPKINLIIKAINVHFHY